MCTGWTMGSVEEPIIALCAAARKFTSIKLKEVLGRDFEVSLNGKHLKRYGSFELMFNSTDVFFSGLCFPYSYCRRGIAYDQTLFAETFMDMDLWVKAFGLYVKVVSVEKLVSRYSGVRDLMRVTAKFGLPSPNYVPVEFTFFRFRTSVSPIMSAVVDVDCSYLESFPFRKTFLRGPSAVFFCRKGVWDEPRYLEVVWVERMQIPKLDYFVDVENGFSARRCVDTLEWFCRGKSFPLCIDKIGYGDIEETRFVCIGLSDSLKRGFFSLVNDISKLRWTLVFGEKFLVYQRFYISQVGCRVSGRQFMAFRTFSVPHSSALVFDFFVRWSMHRWSMGSASYKKIFHFGPFGSSHSLSMYSHANEDIGKLVQVVENEEFFRLLIFSTIGERQLGSFRRMYPVVFDYASGFLVLPSTGNSCQVTFVLQYCDDGNVLEDICNEINLLEEKLISLGR